MPGPRQYRPKPKSIKQRMAAAARARSNLRSRMVSKSRAISVSTGPGRNGFSRRVGGYSRPKTRFQRGVQKVIFATTEKKYRSATINYASGTDVNIDALPWKHNSLRRIDLWRLNSGTGSSGTRIFPTQGMTDGNRIGDEIYASGISVKLMLNLPPDRRTASIKVWYVPHNNVQGNPGDKSQLFHGLINNVMIDQIQTDRWPGIKYLGMFRNSDPDNITASAHGQIYMNLWIPLRRKLTFITDGDTVTARGLKEVGSLIFAPYDKINSLEEDNIINNLQGEITFHYKDP